MFDVKNSAGEIIFVFAHGDNKVFDDADLAGVNLSGAQLEGAWFNGTNLAGANLEGADFYWAIFFQANLSKANLRNALLRGCDFKEANLEGADLSDADLGPDNLSGETELQGANLIGCIVSGTRFERAEYDSKTQFPAGFDPAQHHMQFKPRLP